MIMTKARQRQREMANKLPEPRICAHCKFPITREEQRFYTTKYHKGKFYPYAYCLICDAKRSLMAKDKRKKRLEIIQALNNGEITNEEANSMIDRLQQTHTFKKPHFPRTKNANPQVAPNKAQNTLAPFVTLAPNRRVTPSIAQNT